MSAAPYITRDDARHPEHRHAVRHRVALRTMSATLQLCRDCCRCGAQRDSLVRTARGGAVTGLGSSTYHAGPWEGPTP